MTWGFGTAAQMLNEKQSKHEIRANFRSMGQSRTSGQLGARTLEQRICSVFLQRAG
jgi:hypothetical protein